MNQIGRMKPSCNIPYSLLVAAILLAGCAKEAERTEKAGGDFLVSRLFQHEGCTVYRFRDAGRYIYYVNCPGHRVSAQSSYYQSSGKTGFNVEVNTTTESK